MVSSNIRGVPNGDVLSRMNFRIQVDDESEVLQDYVIEQNTSAVSLYDWQRRAIKFFFKHNGVGLFEVATGAGKTFCAIEIIKK